MKKLFLISTFIFYSLVGYTQEYIEILRAADNNILVNPALAGIDGRNSLSILDRYQRKVFESTISGDKIWDGMNQFTGGSVKKGFYYYQITPIEFVHTKARTIVGVLLLDK